MVKPVSGLILPGQVEGPERPRMTGDMRPLTPEVRAQAGLPNPVDPRSPEYLRRMQPPDPDAGVQVLQETLAGVMSVGAPVAAPASTSDVRAVLSYGPQAGKLVIALERAPDWDVAEGEAWIVSAQALGALLPILKKVTRVKDLTGGAWQIVQPDVGGWTAEAE
jgi:hypothetical protein